MKVRVPKRMPPYTEDSDIEKLIQAMRNKPTHKKTATRDMLLVRLAVSTGLRRAEIANLEVRDIHLDLDDALLEVRQGKGGKNGQVPLTRQITSELRDFIKGMPPEAKVFGLKASSISSKIAHFAKKAGVNLHCHQFRHRFATMLLERGANIRVVQQLMRHGDLSATEVYLSVKQRGLREAIDLLEVEEPHKYPQMRYLESHPKAGQPRPKSGPGSPFSWEVAEFCQENGITVEEYCKT